MVKPGRLARAGKAGSQSAQHTTAAGRGGGRGPALRWARREVWRGGTGARVWGCRCGERWRTNRTRTGEVAPGNVMDEWVCLALPK